MKNAGRYGRGSQDHIDIEIVDLMQKKFRQHVYFLCGVGYTYTHIHIKLTDWSTISSN